MIKCVKTEIINGECVRQFLCDIEADVTNLPKINSEGNESDKWCAAGSCALVLQPETSVYVLGNDDEWHKI